MKQIVFTISQDELAKKLATALKGEAGEIKIERFQDGEALVKLGTNVKNRDTVIIQSIEADKTEELIMVLQLNDVLRHEGASSVTFVAPYICYFRQEYPKGNEPQSSKVIADILDTAHFDKILTCDAHSLDNLKHFETPIENLLLGQLFTEYYREDIKNHGYDPKNVVVISPDIGGAHRAEAVAHELGAELVQLEKVRDHSDSVKKIVMHDDVQGKVCLIIDDVISTGNTIQKVTELLLEKGAEKVIVGATHPIVASGCTDLLKNAQISNIIVTNTLSKELDPVYKVIDITPLIAEEL